MKFVNIKALLCAAGALSVLLCCGCDNLNPNRGNVSATDAASSSEEAVWQPADASEAAEIYAGDTKVEDCFVMKSCWNGEEYENDYSLNQLMMIKYLADDSSIPRIDNGMAVTFKIAESQELKSVKLTQQANTIKANTGIPYNIVEIELSQSGEGEYSFSIDFDKFVMYYYTLDCEWSNGNTAQYSFALEKKEE